MSTNKDKELYKRRQYKFLPDLANWLVNEYRKGNIKKSKRIVKVILKYNIEINYDYLNEEYDKINNIVIASKPRKVLCWDENT